MSHVMSRLTDTYCVYMHVTTDFTPITYERSDLAQLYSLFYPHVNSLTDVSITPALHMFTLWDPILCAHQGTCSIRWPEDGCMSSRNM
jgi:hypothetical protein